MVQIVGQADLADPAVRHLIEPGARPTLDTRPLRDRYIAALWIDEAPIAAAAARIDHGPRRAEIISLGCLTKFDETPALGAVIGHLRAAMTGVGLAVVFDPNEPVDAKTTASLRGGGLAPDGPSWQWFELRPDAVHPALRAAGPRDDNTVISLVDATDAHLQKMREKGQYRPHPDDLPQYSPIVLDAEQEVIAFVVVRRGQPAKVIQWSWVDPAHRGHAIILTVGNAMLDLLERDGEMAPLRGKADMTNAPVLHVVSGVGTAAMRPLFKTQTWVSPKGQ